MPAATTSTARSRNAHPAQPGRAIVEEVGGHERSIKSASFSPDASRIVTASRDGTARLWDARTGEVLTTFDHPDEVWSAAFSPDGARVVTTGGDGGSGYGTRGPPSSSCRSKAIVLTSTRPPSAPTAGAW